MPNVSGNTGETVCLPITVRDFSDVVEFGFSLNWDPNNLNFANIQNVNPALTNFNEDFTVLPSPGTPGYNLTATAGGGLSAYWRLWEDNQECDDLAAGLDLPDDAVLFEVCLEVLSTEYGTLHPVSFFGAPQPLVVNKKLGNGNCTLDAVLGVSPGTITVNVDPLVLSISVPQGNHQPGDLVCVDIIAESGFTNMQGLQFGLDWDRSILQIESVQPNEDIANNSPFIYNVDQAGNCFATSWSYTLDNTGITVAPGTRFASACFRITGDCNDQTNIEVSAACNGSLIEATNSTIQTLAVVTNSDRLRINNCNNFGLDVVVMCGATANVGDNVCIDIKAGDNYEDINSYNYLVRFDEEVMTFTGVQGFLAGSAINISDFNTDNVANGILGVEVDHVPFGPFSAAAGTTLYQVCFDVTGYTPSTPITISDPSSVNESNADLILIGVDPSNCEVNITQPAQVIMNVGDVEVGSAADACLPVTVSNFTDITDISFTLQYDINSNANFDFASITNEALAGATINVLPGTGLFTYTYSGPPVTIPDGGLLFNLCLRATQNATPNFCNPIGVQLFPLAPSAMNQDGTINGIVRNNGEGCVLFPEGFGLVFGNTTTGINSTTCVPVSVVSFDNITSANFNINFDPSSLGYESINLVNNNWPGLTVGDFDITNINTGLISASWTSGGGPVAIPDSTVVFELCMNALTTPGCVDIDGNATTQPSSTTSAGDGSIVFTDGEVCIVDRIAIDSVVAIETPCAGQCEGKIVIRAITGGQESQDIFVRLETNGSINPTAFVGDTLRNICPGWNYFVLYTADGDLTTRDSVFVEIDQSQAATANAGPDQQLSCNNTGCSLITSNGNVGVTFNIYRLENDILSPRVTNEDVVNGSITYCAPDNGVYVLEVISAGGCSAFDTVEVRNPELPIAEAGPATMVLDCNNPQIMLDGAGSSTDGIVNYLWEQITPDGPIDTLGTTLPVVIDSAGRYRLTVIFPQSQCVATDEIIVSDMRTPPNVNLPDTVSMGCDGSSAFLDAGPSVTDLTFAWEAANGDPLGNGPTLTVSSAQSVTLTVTNTITGCATMRVIEVVENQGDPLVLNTDNQPINCGTDTIQLTPTFTNVSGNQTYSWETTGGSFVIGQQNAANPIVIGMGTYNVTVTDGECSGTATIEVVDPVLPIADAGSDMNLMCGQSLTIDGSNSQATNASYLWFTAGDTINGATSNMLTVSEPGLYAIEVRDLSTNCRTTDTVEVLPALGFPTVTLPDTVFGLTCDPGGLIINPNVNTANDPFTLSIDGPGAPIVNPDNSGNITVFEPGIHTLTVTNNSNNCSANFTFRVDGANIQLPFAAISVPLITLTCVEPTATLSGALSSDGPNIRYRWENIIDGEEPSQQDNDTLIVGTPGTYVLTVINTESQCSASDTVRVQDGRSFPVVNELPFNPISCDNPNTTLSIDIADTSGLFIQWFGPPMGNPPSALIGENVLSVDVSGPSNYTAVVVDQASSCITQVSYLVELDTRGIENIQFAPVDTFDCSSETVTIDASASLENPNGVSIEWESLEGNTVTPANGSLIVSVSGPGSYVLTLSVGEGCTNTDTIFVEAANDTPLANAGPDLEVECGEMPMLEAQNSTPPVADTFIYTWTAIGDGTIVSGQDGPNPVVSGPGTYALLITNLINMCESSDTVSVSLIGQEAAQLPIDFNTCSDTATVTANLPAGTTGEWNIIQQTSETITFNNNVANIVGLSSPVSLSWTLSATGCENYSSDTITVSQASAPVAVDDIFVIQGNNGVGTLDLVENDQPNGQVTATLLDTVPFGEIISFLNGELTFDAGAGISGSFVLRYRICNEACGTCDEASVTVRVDADGQMPPVYNTITPNGDRLNEFLVFDLLELNPEEYPDNSLIIFNRWGDILYEAKPYNNDWNGVNQNGKELPEGTYYYILRLSLGEGDIIRGDITILR